MALAVTRRASLIGVWERALASRGMIVRIFCRPRHQKYPNALRLYIMEII